MLFKNFVWITFPILIKQSFAYYDHINIFPFVAYFNYSYWHLTLLILTRSIPVFLSIQQQEQNQDWRDTPHSSAGSKAKIISPASASHSRFSGPQHHFCWSRLLAERENHWGVWEPGQEVIANIVHSWLSRCGSTKSCPRLPWIPDILPTTTLLLKSRISYYCQWSNSHLTGKRTPMVLG